MKSLKNSTDGKECSKLVFSSLGPVLEELGITEIPLQSQLYPLNWRTDLIISIQFYITFFFIYKRP